LRNGSPVGSFSVRGRYRVRSGAYRFRVSVAVKGTDARDRLPDTSPNATYWKGTLKAAVVVLWKGRRIDRCASRNVRWTGTGYLPVLGTAATGSFQMHGDPGEYLSGGSSYSYTAPPTQMRADAGGRLIYVEVGGWFLHFDAPRGEVLRTGTYSNARGPINEPGPTLSIGGHGRACSSAGSFTIHSIDVDHHYRVRSADISFELRCNGAAPALRGRVSFTRTP
jgi:hypothetical protein